MAVKQEITRHFSGSPSLVQLTRPQLRSVKTFGYDPNPLGNIPPSVVLAGATGVSVAALASLVALSSRSDRKSQSSTASKPKPPHRFRTTLPLVGDTWDAITMGQSAFMTSKMLDECVRVSGEPLLVRLLGQPDMLVLSDPQAVEDVLKTHFNHFERGVYETFFELTGDSLFGTDGDAWQVQRRVFAKLFTPTMLRGSGKDGDDGVMPIIHRHATTLHRLLQVQARPLDSGGDTDSNGLAPVVNLSALLSDFTVEVVTEIGFGVALGFLPASTDCAQGNQDIDEDDNDPHKFMDAVESVASVIGQRFVFPLWLWKLKRALGCGSEREVPGHVARIDRFAMTLINRSLVANTNRADGRRKNVVSVFMDEVSGDLNDSDAKTIKLLRDVTVGFLIAGRDSTAQTLSWVFYCLARHPHVEQQLVDEISLLWPPYDAGQPFLPTVDQLQRLVYSEAVLRETMRLYPVVAFNTRHCVSDTLLSDGTLVTAGTRIGLPMFAMGRMPSIWDQDADEFRPERWLETVGTATRLKNVSVFRFPAFHAGPR